MRTRKIRESTIVLIACTMFVAGCGSPPLDYVEQGRDFTAESALGLSESVDPGSLASRSVADSESLRSRALSRLRSRGDAAAKTAALLTRIFPSEKSGVPFYVERGSFEGTAAIVIVEAIGPEGGRLADERIWVLSETGDVLLTGTR